MASLDRFLSAQEQVYPRALAELQSGAKRTHWMWYIFPQIEGLGHSPMAQRFAIADLAEAEAYLAHPVLGARLLEATGAMLGWAGEHSALDILGAVDTLKFASSMTLFEAAGGGERFARALELFFGGERDQRTLERIGKN